MDPIRTTTMARLALLALGCAAATTSAACGPEPTPDGGADAADVPPTQDVGTDAATDAPSCVVTGGTCTGFGQCCSGVCSSTPGNISGTCN